MMNRYLKIFATTALSIFWVAAVNAQVVASDSVLQNRNAKSRLSIGGYGEINYGRNFYSDHVSRYSQPEEHKNDPSHGRFDIPHAVIYLGYDFGKGWSFGTEIEFEHGDTGIAYEKKTKKAVNGNRRPRKAAKWNWNSSGFRSHSLHGPT